MGGRTDEGCPPIGGGAPRLQLAGYARVSARPQVCSSAREGAIRLGILSDFHGNLPALDAMVSALTRAGVDRFVCLGDLVGYGPFPREAVERIRAISEDVVAGNHDLLTICATLPGSPLAQRPLQWTRNALGPANLDCLRSLPGTVEPAAGVVGVHSSLAGPSDYVWSGALAPASSIGWERSIPRCGVLLVGHTHVPMAYGLEPAFGFKEDEGLSDSVPANVSC